MPDCVAVRLAHRRAEAEQAAVFQDFDARSMRCGPVLAFRPARGEGAGTELSSTSRRPSRNLVAETRRATQRRPAYERTRKRMTLYPRRFAAIAFAVLCALALTYGRAGAAEPELTPLTVESFPPKTRTY